MKLFQSTKSKITKDENGENVPHLEISEVVLIRSNIVYNNYQQDSRVLHTFVPDKSFSQLLDISPKNFVYWILYIYTDQDFKALEIEHKITITLVMN